MREIEIEENHRVNLTDTAYEIIKANIISGKFRQGDALSISGMSKKLKISRTPTSNACQILENEGFLKIVPKLGVIINVISPANARNIYGLRIALETYSARNAFEYFDDEDVAFLQRSFERQLKHMADKNILEFMKEDINFHKYILIKRENVEITNVFDNILERAYLLGVESCKNHARLENNIEEHKDIIIALKEKKLEDFVEAIENNILKGLASLVGNII